MTFNRKSGFCNFVDMLNLAQGYFSVLQDILIILEACTNFVMNNHESKITFYLIALIIWEKWEKFEILYEGCGPRSNKSSSIAVKMLKEHI